MILTLSTALGCGYFQSGTWEDDPKNYRRALGMRPPKEITIVRSWYWRSPHFTREEAFYFHIVGGPGFAEAFALANHMTEVEVESLEGFSFCFERPDWFAPEDAGRYRAWVAEEERALALQQEHTGDSFVYGCQV